MAKVVVTGACGGIGSKLVRQLLDVGYEVIAIDNLYSGSWSNIEEHRNLVKITVDITDSKNLTDALSAYDFEYCIHLAAISSLPECQIDPRRAMEVNFLATVALVEICSGKNDFRAFLFASTSAVYEGIKSDVFSEDLTVNPVLVYPQSKFYSELYLRSVFQSRGFPILITRLFNVFGDLQNSMRKSPPLINYLVREISNGRSPTLFGWNAPPRDYISVDHVVDYFLLLLNSPEAIGRILNICTGSGLTVKQIFEIVSVALESDIQPTIESPKDLWSSYNELGQGSFPLDPFWIESETNKFSLGSPKAIEELLGNSKKFDLDEEISSVARKIMRNLRESVE
jgi:nucleoside-diphosphate-sugar epimerase